MFENSRGRGRIGVLVPYTNSNLEPDLNAMRPNGVSLHFTRIAGYSAEDIPGSDEMKHMADTPVNAAIDLLGAINPDVILYGCTSATLTISPKGDSEMASQMSVSCGRPVITAAGAIIAALKEIHASRIAICTPYNEELSKITEQFYQTAGFDVASTVNPAEDMDSLEQGKFSSQDVTGLALKADAENVEAIVIACTDLRAVESINTIEKITGKPVISSNQALMFAACKAMQIKPTTIPGILGASQF